MPWLAKSSPEFMYAFETFWGNWAEHKCNFVFIACGSVTSWMVEKVFHNRGGLFQRCTCWLDVKPLRLYEVEELRNGAEISCDFIEFPVNFEMGMNPRESGKWKSWTPIRVKRCHGLGDLFLKSLAVGRGM